jgi:hypothetical protein
MPEITINTNTQPEEKKQVQTNEVIEKLKAVDEYQKFKEQNDKLEAELERQQELLNKMRMGGRALAGQYTLEKTPEELAKEEAAKLLKSYI